MLKSCGFGMQFVGVLFLIGGLIALAARLWSGVWLPIGGREWSPFVSGVLVGMIILLGAGYIVLGARLKVGSLAAATISVLVAWPVWLMILVYFLSTWKAFYELFLWSSVLLDGHVALIQIGENRRSMTDTS